MDPKTLLERMASISPGVLLHITGQLWQLNIDEDDINQKILVNECFAVMIKEAYDLGIEFYCTLDELCESYYAIDKGLLLFESIFPTPLYRNITESPSFKTVLESIVLNGAEIAGESSVMTLLEHLALYNEPTQSVFADTYAFLQDKMQSTAMFDQYAASILSVANTPRAIEIDPDFVQAYLQLVQMSYSHLLKIADFLNHASINGLDNFNFDSVYDAIDDYKTIAIEADTLEEYSWAQTAKQESDPLPVTQALIEKYRVQFASSIPFYDEFFIARKITTLTTTDLITLVMGAFLSAQTHEAFSSAVQTSFALLKANNLMLSESQNIMVQQIVLKLIQELSS